MLASGYQFQRRAPEADDLKLYDCEIPDTVIRRPHCLRWLSAVVDLRRRQLTFFNHDHIQWNTLLKLLEFSLLGPVIFLDDYQVLLISHHQLVLSRLQ